MEIVKTEQLKTPPQQPQTGREKTVIKVMKVLHYIYFLLFSPGK